MTLEKYDTLQLCKIHKYINMYVLIVCTCQYMRYDCKIRNANTSYKKYVEDLKFGRPVGIYYC